MKTAKFSIPRTILSAFLLSLAVLAACTRTDKPDARVVVTTAACDQLLKESTKPVVLDFWASWCGPCKKMDPIFAEAALERPEVVFGKVNVDQEPELAKKYEVRAIPTLVVIVDGKVVNTSVGFLAKPALLELVDATLEKKPQP